MTSKVGKYKYLKDKAHFIFITFSTGTEIYSYEFNRNDYRLVWQFYIEVMTYGLQPLWT